MRFISPLAWPGGKSRYIDKVVKYFPLKIFNYVEPFCGGASVGLKLISENRISNNIIFSDLNKDLMTFWKDVKENKIIKQYPDLTSLKAARKAFYSVQKYDKRGWEYLLINRLSFSGVEKAGFSITRWEKKYYNCLDRVKICENLLKDVILLNDDYRKIVEKYDGENTFFYFDPPYYKVSKNIYVHEKFNYQKFHKMLLKIKGKFILSLNNHSEMRKLFENFYMHDENWVYAMSNGTRKNKRNKFGQELVITNFEINLTKQTTLF